MRFRTFRIIGLFAVIGIGVSTVAGVKYLLDHRPTPQLQVQTAAPVAPATRVPAQVPAASVTTETVRAQLDVWLEAHPDRNGKTKLVDFLPNAPFRATAIRFPEADAVKWSDNPRQWSQIRLDLNRDGVDDEKWLLKNGHTYKRETLDRSGHVTGTEYFS